jgi:hypothetical protein
VCCYIRLLCHQIVVLTDCYFINLQFHQFVLSSTSMRCFIFVLFHQHQRVVYQCMVFINILSMACLVNQFKNLIVPGLTLTWITTSTNQACITLPIPSSHLLSSLLPFENSILWLQETASWWNDSAPKLQFCIYFIKCSFTSSLTLAQITKSVFPRPIFTSNAEIQHSNGSLH